MTLGRTIARVAATNAIAGATLAGDAVFDSSIDPIDQRVSEDARPMVVIYTDDQKSDPSGRADYLQESSCELVIEMVVAGRTSVTVDDTTDEIAAVQISIPPTDAMMEVTLDLLERQVVRALTAGTGPWAHVWRSIVPRVLSCVSRRGAGSRDGNRFAARQMVLECDLIMDPDQGAALPADSVWSSAIDLMAATPGMESLAEILRADAEGAHAVTDWRRTAARLGIEPEIVRAIGIGPISGTDDPATLADGVVVDGRADP